ncbi:3-isopropylmalate dehydrogenase [Arthrobacter sp. KNU40]|uniref:3-isopropylmalate dehydrogenase n=1 Tax=Arthrobacter sp. KNU40 TaxID=3447965 RepID=UPI003F61AE2F
MSARIVVLPGDGIGPEVINSALDVLNVVADDLEFEKHLVGGASMRAFGRSLTDEAFAACSESDAILFGSVGDPSFPLDGADKPEEGLRRLRFELDLYANLRPVKPRLSLADASPFRWEHLDGTDMLIVRELTGGLYFGGKHESSEHRAIDESVYTTAQVDRVARVAFRVARRKVTSVDKANILETGRLWRTGVTKVGEDFPDVELVHMLVDNAAMQLIANPRSFDVLLTENLFGDILSDEASMLTGSLGMLPSASLGDPGVPGLFEPSHGSAPDIAGRGVANPMAAILTAAMMLRMGLNRPDEAEAIESAVDKALTSGTRTRDLGGIAGTQEMTQAVLAAL